eukprot:TRINITY_DN17398_c0_g1_i1.p1 TRINITY_DN17398_c0_g1~~TRINITY_DN17398_c0_g1_i1.p1  ORF type:complete len:461 (+),score=106.12 TRINITY_DN17398_c0_g1_i1:52-1383(+)
MTEKGAWRQQQTVDRVLQYSMSDDDSPCARMPQRCGSVGLETMMSLDFKAQPYVSPISPPRNVAVPQGGKWRSGSYSPEEYVMTDDGPRPDQFTEMIDEKSNQELAEENSRLHAWNNELHAELSDLSKELSKHSRQSSSVEKLERKLQDKAQIIDALREKVKELAIREETQRYHYEDRILKMSLGNTKHHDAQSGAELAKLEEEKAKLTLLHEERGCEILNLEENLSEKTEQLTQAIKERSEIETRMNSLQDIVTSMARTIQEIKQKHETGMVLKEDLQELRFVVEDLQTEKEMLKADHDSQIESISRELDTLQADSLTWQRRYKELRSSMPSHGDDPDEYYARQQHNSYEDISNVVSDTLWLQKVVSSFSVNGTIDRELYAGNSEALADRRHRLEGQSVQKSCEVAYEHLQNLKSTIMDTIARRQEAGSCDYDERGGGCDIQ